MKTLEQTFIYCTQCRSDLNQMSGFKLCPNCNKRYYFNPKPTVGLLVYNDSKELLLTKRAVDPYKDWWDLPGGFVEDGENFEQAASRELEEETGLRVLDWTYAGSVVEDYEYNDELHRVLAVVFTGNVPNGAIVTVADDVNDYRFISIGDIDFEKIAFDNQRIFMKKLLA
jgi:ADP-ribose pyrophosphatase YjhB (NUDIX family)